MTQLHNIHACVKEREIKNERVDCVSFWFCPYTASSVLYHSTGTGEGDVADAEELLKPFRLRYPQVSDTPPPQAITQPKANSTLYGTQCVPIPADFWANTI
jgi:hypothetical protein